VSQVGGAEALGEHFGSVPLGDREDRSERDDDTAAGLVVVRIDLCDCGAQQELDELVRIRGRGTERLAGAPGAPTASRAIWNPARRAFSPGSICAVAESSISAISSSGFLLARSKRVSSGMRLPPVRTVYSAAGDEPGRGARGTGVVCGSDAAVGGVVPSGPASGGGLGEDPRDAGALTAPRARERVLVGDRPANRIANATHAQCA
jgi:hypothetical protein